MHPLFHSLIFLYLPIFLALYSAFKVYTLIKNDSAVPPQSPNMFSDKR